MMPIIYKSRRPARITHAMPKYGKSKQGRCSGGARGGGARGGVARDLRGSLLSDRPRITTSQMQLCLIGLFGSLVKLSMAMEIVLTRATVIVDLANQPWVVDLMAMSEFRTMFTNPPVIVAACTTVMNIVPAICASMLDIVRNGNVYRGERMGVEEDRKIAEHIAKCRGDLVLFCGDGKTTPGDDDIYRAVEAHLAAGFKVILVAREGTCSGNYDALQYHGLLRVVRWIIPQ